MINPDWGRWIKTSVISFFDSRKLDLPLYIEGSDKAGRRASEDYAEFRINGPFFKEQSKDYWYITFDVNILVACFPDGKDAYKIDRNLGRASRMFGGEISIFKLGDEVQDTKQYLECALMEMEGLTGGIQTFHYGKIDPVVNTIEASVEASYKLYLTSTIDDLAIFLSVSDVLTLTDSMVLI